jgi:magnesium-transporting ATPase (P-type)
MDTLGALALASEPPSDSILKRKPYAKDDAIMTESMWRNVFGHAIYQMAVIAFVIFCFPGWLVKDYWTLCKTYNSMDSTKCEVWNPYYATTLYQTENSIRFWTQKNLSA